MTITHASAATVTTTKSSSGKLISHLAGLPEIAVDNHASTSGVSTLFGEMKSHKINVINSTQAPSHYVLPHCPFSLPHTLVKTMSI